MLRRQMQQAGCLVLLLHLGELFDKVPGVLRRHLAILFPFDARQLVGRHQQETWDFKLRNPNQLWSANQRESP